MSSQKITDETKEPSRFKAWLIIGLIVIGIAAITAIFSFTGSEEECNCPPIGWQIIRPPEFVLALEEQGEIIWAGGLDGLFAIDRSTGEILPSMVNGAPPITYVNDILVDRNGMLWIGHWGGLVRFKEGMWHSYTESEGIPQGPVKSLLEDKTGTLWIGTENGVIRLNDVGIDHFVAEEGLGFSEVDVIFQDRDGVFWLGSASLTRGGLTRYDGRNWQNYTAKDGLAHNSVNDIIQDSSGALWIATGFGGSGGANIIEGDQWSTLTKEDGLAGEKVRSL